MDNMAVGIDDGIGKIAMDIQREIGAWCDVGGDGPNGANHPNR